MQSLMRLVLSLLLLVLGPFSAQGLEPFERSTLVIETEGGEHSFNVEIARSQEQQAHGLMFRREMPGDHGMLFDYDPPRRVGMWMKNTFIPLDMLFIDADGRIVRIAERTLPHSLDTIDSGRTVRGVLELNAGTAARLRIRPGDRVRHPIFGDAG